MEAGPGQASCKSVASTSDRSPSLAVGATNSTSGYVAVVPYSAQVDLDSHPSTATLVVPILGGVLRVPVQCDGAGRVRNEPESERATREHEGDNALPLNQRTCLAGHGDPPVTVCHVNNHQEVVEGTRSVEVLSGSWRNRS